MNKKIVIRKTQNVGMSEFKAPYEIVKENANQAYDYARTHMSEYDFTVNLMCPLPKGKNNVDIQS